MSPRRTGAAPWSPVVVRLPRPGVCPGLPGGQHTRPFLQLWACHRCLILDMHLWKNIFSRQS